MENTKRLNISGHEHSAVAVRELIDHESDYDTATTAWAKFDRHMTWQLQQLERQLHQYFTPTACRRELGR